MELALNQNQRIEPFCSSILEIFKKLVRLNNPYNKFLPSVDNFLYHKIYDLAVYENLKKNRNNAIQKPSSKFADALSKRRFQHDTWMQ